MATKLIGPAGICGCGSEGSASLQEYLDCCNVLDLGVVYEQEPDYKTNDPCEGGRVDNTFDCSSAPTIAPHGKILPYRRACARLVVWSGAKITGSITYKTRTVLYSRQRIDLPTEECGNPILCPAENGIYECCSIGTQTSPSHSKGLYDGCVKDDNFSTNCLIDCSGATAQFYKFGMSNCSLNGKILAGYATAPSDWWFLSTNEFGGVENQIVQNNPYGDLEHTIYAHFQLEWKPIKCTSLGGAPSCGGRGKINLFQGRCGDSHMLGLKNKEERERAVKITAAIGFSVGSCGYTPQTACEKIAN